MRAHPGRIAAFTAAAAATSRELKHFLYCKVYSSPDLVDERSRSMAMVEELFQYFAADPDRLPEPYRTQARSQPHHRVVCDYLAGMTDAFLRRTHEQIFATRNQA